MSTVKGIKVGSADITGRYENTYNPSDTVHLIVDALNLEECGSISSPNTTTYDGSSQTPLPIVTAIVGNESVVLVKDTDYTLSYTNNKNAGIATVTATGINNYTGSISSNWNIINAEIIVETTDQSYTYDGNAYGSGPNVSVVDGTPTIRYRLTDYGDYTIINTPKFINVSESGLIYYKVTAPNHNDYEGSYKVIIKPKTASLAWGSTSWRYDGNPHSTTCTVTNLVPGDTCTVILSGNSITNIGSTTVTATGLSNSNYKLPESGITQTLTINPGLFVKISGNWTPVKAVYKRVSGSWVQQDMTTAFSTSGRYIKSN